MKHKYDLIVAAVLIAVIVTSGCLQQNPCEELAKNFDAKKDSIGPEACNAWSESREPIWVGGKLINVSKMYQPGYERNEFTLTFQGFETQGNIYIGTTNEGIPYEIGKFYKFDLGNKCKLLYSAASSGAFSDPDLDALEHLEQCD